MELQHWDPPTNKAPVGNYLSAYPTIPMGVLSQNLKQSPELGVLYSESAVTPRTVLPFCLGD